MDVPYDTEQRTLEREQAGERLVESAPRWLHNLSAASVLFALAAFACIGLSATEFNGTPARALALALSVMAVVCGVAAMVARLARGRASPAGSSC